jgi:hypothetical protein
MKTGDIALFIVKNRNLWRSWVTLAIRLFQGNPVTHTAIVVEDNFGVIVEAWWPRSRRYLLNLKNECHWAIVRPKECTDEVLDQVGMFANSLCGTKYDKRGVLKLGFWYLMEWTLGIFIRRNIKIEDSESKLFCSELVAYCYEKVGFNLLDLLGHKDISSVTPGDIARNIDKLEMIETIPGWPPSLTRQ